MLIDANIYFTREKGNYRIGTRWCYYDFFVPYWRMYFELDGHSHDSKEQKEIDFEKDRIIRNKQRFICRISNDYVLNEMSKIDFDIAKDLLFKYMVKSRFLRKKKQRLMIRQKAIMSSILPRITNSLLKISPPITKVWILKMIDQ